MHYKVQEEGAIKHKALYNVIGINCKGKKEALGGYIAENEGAKFWLQVLANLQNRGLKDILIACTDNLKGFSEAIQSVFPKTEIQTCVIHQVRNSLRYVASKEKKDFMKDLKLIYKTDTKELAEEALSSLSDTWKAKYPLVIKSWQHNWDKLNTYFDYTPSIRKLIYTTNPVESYHRGIRKITKTKGAFSSDMALLKLVYLGTKNITNKWQQPIPNWGLVVQQLFIRFGSRMPVDLEVDTSNRQT